MASDSASAIRAKTSVWWDMEECDVPKGFDIDVIIHNIKTALLKMNYCEPVSFFVYTDTTRLPSLLQKALQSNGISLCHVPAGLKDDLNKKVLVDMLFWAFDNPAPSNFLLFSGKKDFSYALEQLDMRGYNILLAHPANASDALFLGAKSVWQWTSLLSGGFPLASGEIIYPKRLPAQDAFRMNQAALADTETAPTFLEVSKPKFPAIPIPNLFPRSHNYDMLEKIESFNKIRKQLNIIEYYQAEKVSRFNYSNKEECQPFFGYKNTGVCHALDFMSKEMMIPTKENIQDVVRYGDLGDHDFNVEKALKIELKYDMIVTQNLGDLPLYLPKELLPVGVCES